MAGVARGQHAVEHVDAGDDGGDDVPWLAHAHEIAGPVRRKMRHRRLQRRHHRLGSLAHGQPAHRVSGEADLAEPRDALGAKIGLEPPLHDAEQRLVGTLVRRATPRGPAGAPQHRVGHRVPRCGEGHHMIHLHRHVGPDPLLDPHRVLRRERRGRAVDVGSEEGAVLRDPHLLREAEDLIAAGVGERRALPPHERGQPGRPLDRLLTRPEVEVVGIGENHARAGLGHAADIDPLDRRGRRHRHEQRRGHAAMRSREEAGPRRTIRGLERQRESGPHGEKTRGGADGREPA